LSEWNTTVTLDVSNENARELEPDAVPVGYCISRLVKESDERTADNSTAGEANANGAQ
jgi:hypothetical protein